MSDFDRKILILCALVDFLSWDKYWLSNPEYRMGRCME